MSHTVEILSFVPCMLPLAQGRPGLKVADFDCRIDWLVLRGCSLVKTRRRLFVVETPFEAKKGERGKAVFIEDAVLRVALLDAALKSLAAAEIDTTQKRA